MPEGPEIRQSADAIARAITYQPVDEVFFAFEHLKIYESQLTGRIVTAVKPRGKALLTQFDNGLSIYSHNQLYGKWMIRKARQLPTTQRQLRLAIHTAKKSALLYSASDIEVLDDLEIAQHPFLSKLGPDVLDDDTPFETVAAQVQSPKFRRRRLAALLLDQQFLCGLGNYLRSEVLFMAGIHPLHRPCDCSEHQLTNLAQAAIALTRQSYETGGITNDLAIASELRSQGKKRWEYRHWVFYRDGRPCFRCGTTILKDTVSGRRCYYCPTCQSS
ncbi:MAG: endonuclease VIII [Synechococcales cyanobacterium T60_A2020_003]|nr:endonuclease VIII [Synechococcales cyanobacterium T60_A2020_003]